MKIWALGFITMGALGVLNAPKYLLLWILRGTGPLSDQGQLAVDHLGAVAMLAGIGLIVVGAVMWIAEPEPLLSTKETRRHHIISAATSAACGVLTLLTAIPGQPLWWRWSGVTVFSVLTALEVVKAVRFKAMRAHEWKVN
jgi:hypothetical protein